MEERSSNRTKNILFSVYEVKLANAQLGKGQRQVSVLNQKSKSLGFLGDKKGLGLKFYFPSSS